MAQKTTAIVGTDNPMVSKNVYIERAKAGGGYLPKEYFGSVSANIAAEFSCDEADKITTQEVSLI